ncbi:MAG: hypothetical protein V8Q58_00315 [Anaerobutyricum hallii]
MCGEFFLNEDGVMCYVN